MTKIQIEIDPELQRVVPVSPDANECRLTLIHQIHELSDHIERGAASVIDKDMRKQMLGQREYALRVSAKWNMNGNPFAAPQPEPVDADLRRDAELWRAHQKRKQDLIDRGFLRNPLRAAPQACLAEIVTIDAAMLSQGEQKCLPKT